MPFEFIALAKQAGSFTAKLFLKDAIKSVPSLRPVRRLKMAMVRGTHGFGIPEGPIHIVLSEVAAGEGSGGVPALDSECSDVITRLFEQLGLRRDRDWFIHRISQNESLDDRIRRQNLVTICGPVANGFVKELLDREPPFLDHVRYLQENGRESRRFLWRSHSFQWRDGRDFALFAVKPNPFDESKRIVMLLGLRDVGSLGAAKVFSHDQFGPLRLQIGNRFLTTRGNMEVLLRVDHALADRRRVADVRVAEPADGESLLSTSRLEPLEPATRSLQRIYTSLRTHPRPVVIRDHVYELTVTADHSIRFLEEATWVACDGDIVVRGKEYGADPPLKEIRDLQFAASVVNGAGEVVQLPAESQPTTKRFLLFPVPPIKKDQTPPRVRYTAVWPGAALTLLETGKDEHTMDLFQHLAEPVDTVRFVIRFETPGVRYRVSEVSRENGTPGAVAEVSGTGSHALVAYNVRAGTRFTFLVERIE
jgi:hypothetical protein